MPRGYLCLLLHAHLPFVRHPEHAEFLEEKWLFEAVTGCYLPLLGVFERLANDGVPYRITLSISPTLAAMLDDDLLRNRCRAYLEQQYAKSRNAPAFIAKHCASALRDYKKRRGDVLSALARLQAGGHLDLITTAATHGFLPLLKTHPPSVRAQIRVAMNEHRRRFGKHGPRSAHARGFWLPECGFYANVEKELSASEIRYFVVDAHGFLTANKSWPHGNLAPADCRGVAAFARDPDSAREVWGPGGFPGAAVYRDFHARDSDGFKSFAVTGDTAKKRTYDPAQAGASVVRHAQQFVRSRIAQADFHAPRLPHPPVITAAYDAELFGHWWYEGPQFIEQVVRHAATHRDDLELITPGDFCARHPLAGAVIPGASSWGQHGFNEYWLNTANHWIYPQLQQASKRYTALVAAEHECRERAPSEIPSQIRCRALQQAGRSLLLAQASDWPFLMTRGVSAAYAEKRLRDQLARVHYLCEGLEKSKVSEVHLRALEKMDNIFPELDCQHFM